MTTTQKPKNRRNQIIRESTRLFSQHGYKGTSMRGIAKACAVSEAAIYRHFDNKVHLYEAVIQSKARQHDIEGHLEPQRNQGDVESVLTAVAEHILSYLDTDPELLRLMFNNSVETGPVSAVLFKEVRLPYITFLKGELERRIAGGEVREVDPFITSRCFVGMVMDCALSVGVWAKVSNSAFNPGDVICNNVPIFARGLSTQVAPL